MAKPRPLRALQQVRFALLSFTLLLGFTQHSILVIAAENIVLKPGERVTISTFFGVADHILDVPVFARRAVQTGFVLYKLTRTREIIRQITESIETRTSSKRFNEHVKQMYLDNSLRGGIPIILGGADDDDGFLTVDEDAQLKVFHVFSRIHGGLERDYNDFVLSPTFFSQVSFFFIVRTYF